MSADRSGGIERPVIRVVSAAYPSPTEPRRAHFIEDLHNALAPRFQFEVLCPRVHDSDPLVEERGDVIVTRFPYRSGGRRPKEGRLGFRALASYVRSARRVSLQVWSNDARGGLVVGHWIVPTGWIAAGVGKRLGLPVVVHGHGSDLHRYARKGFGRVLARRTIARACRVLASSESLVREADALGAGYARSVSGSPGPGGAIELPVGVEPAFFEARAAVRRPDSGEGRASGRRVIFVGDFVRSKGADRVADLARRAAQSDANMHVEAWGTGPLEEELVKSGVEVRGVGTAIEIAEAMSRSDLLLLPSDAEGASLVAREAIVVGIPVAATPVGSIPDLFRDRRGWLELPHSREASDFPTLEPWFLRPSMLEDERRGIREDFEATVEDLSVESLAARFGDLLDDAIAQSRGCVSGGER